MKDRQTTMVVSMEGDDRDFSPESVALALVRRLQTVLSAENGEIMRASPVRHGDHALEKQRILLELTRLGPSLANWSVSPRLGREIQELVDLLELNGELLKLRLRAARHMGDIVARAMLEGQSDGTYSARDWRA